jgi:NADPH:quinone reductase-like Zn-dependent oxidoreductase
MMGGLFFRAAGSLPNLTVEELAKPSPKGGEVLVQVVAAAINPSDVKSVLEKCRKPHRLEFPAVTLLVA